MIMEMHCHSREHSPCSRVSAVALVRRAFDQGLQGIALTDHHHPWPAADLDALRREAGGQEFFLLRIGPSTLDGGREELIVKTYETPDEWHDARRTVRILDRLIENGFDAGPYRVPRPLDEDPDKLVFIEQAVHGRALYDHLFQYRKALTRSSPDRERFIR